MCTDHQATTGEATDSCQPSSNRLGYTTCQVTPKAWPLVESRKSSLFHDDDCVLEATRSRSSTCCKVRDDTDIPQSSFNSSGKEDGYHKRHRDKNILMPSQNQLGTRIDSLGCLCEALLAFDIKPCCTTTSPAYKPSQGLATVQISHPSCPIEVDSNTVPLAQTTTSTTISKSNISWDYCNDNISPNEVTREGVNFNAKGTGDCRTKGSCVTNPLKSTALKPYRRAKRYFTNDPTPLESMTTGSVASECSQKACCRGANPGPVREKPVKDSREFTKAGCFSINEGAEFPGTKVDSLSTFTRNEVCTSNSMCATKFTEESHYSGGTCCNSSGMAGPCIDTDHTGTHPAASESKIDSTDASATWNIEKGLPVSEHLVLSVQGMTCVGCEKMLYRTLESLPAVSNIKTSLILAQAEFDLRACTAVDSENITKVVERMTGFTCTKVTQLGYYLDLIVDSNMHEHVAAADLPTGITDLTVTNKTAIRVTYLPKMVGARDLLSDPFFQKRGARLAPVAPRPMVASARSHIRTIFFMTILSALLTIPVLVLAWAPLPKHEVLYGGISLVLATTVQVVVAGPFYINAFKALIFSHMVEMDLLIVLSTSTAYIYSVIAYAYLVAGQPLLTGQFFETSTLLVTLIMVGRCVSAYARQRAVESISIESLQTPTALLVDQESHQEREIDARLLQYHDVFKVLPDTSIVTDGIVLAGDTEVDESTVTGEAMLVTKKPGMFVIAGSINHSGTLIVRLTRLPHENTIKTISTMVDEAKSGKPKIQDIADRVASIFIPVILVVTVFIFVVWIAVGIAGRHESAITASIVAMTYAISSLIISCPCAIGLAVPMVVAITGGVAAKHGLVVKSADTIEIARNVSHVIFDKTGTLTQGKLSVADETYLAEPPDVLAPVVMGLTASSKHPVSVSITAHMKALGVQPSPAEKVISVTGKGIEATWKGVTVRAGNPHWLGVENVLVVQQILSRGLTIFCVTLDGDLAAVFGLLDSLRADAIEVIGELKRRSIDVSIVSGDSEVAVQSIARLLGIPPSHVRSRCSPGDKQMYVKEMTTCKKSTVVFCGDGTNDSVALAQASIGMHMSEGTDIAQSAADVVIMRSSLSGILILIDLSKAFYRRVVFNFSWSFIYNIFAILLAAGAFPNARIPPQFAGLGEIASVLPVVAIALQLRLFKFKGFS